MDNKHEKRNRVIRFLSFCLVLSFLLYVVSMMLSPKDNSKDSGMLNPSSRGFLSEKPGTIDIFVIGNSDAYSGFSPMELWKAYGYTSYVCGEGAQLASGSYYMLKEILRVHSPKLVILETDLIFTGGSQQKLVEKMVGDAARNCLPLLQNHDNWKTMDYADLFRDPVYSTHYFYKGQMIVTKTVPNPDNYYKLKKKKYKHIPLYERPYLEALISLCRANDIDLLFAQLPSASSWNHSKKKLIDEYARKKGIPFVDLDSARPEFGFDWRTDTRDGGNHLNALGAKKTTVYFGQYLSSHYTLCDHRSDEAYRGWDADYLQYLQKISRRH